VKRFTRVLGAVYRHVRAIVVIVAVAIAVALATTVTVDLGPSLKGRAEREGSGWIDRPMHIGRLAIHLGRGRFLIEDLRIEGLTPESRPWLVAKRIEVSLTWRALFHREVLLDAIEMTDWRMVVETFPDGRHNWPRLNGPPRPPSGRPRPVVTTLQHVRAHRGEFVFDDHGGRWGVVAPNLDVTVAKTGDYGGGARFHGGTVRFAGFEPMWANLSTSFKIQAGKVLLDRIDLTTDGAVSVLSGTVDLTRWPEMFYNIESRVEFSRMREIFFAKETFSLHGQGQFTGTFHVFKGGRELEGDFYSREAGLNDYRFQDLEGSLEWVPDRFEVLDASSGFHGGRTSFRYMMSPLGRPGQRGRARFDVTYENVDLARFTDFLELRGIRLGGAASGRNHMEWPLGGFGDRQGEGTIAVSPPPGAVPLGPDLPPGAAGAARARAARPGPFSNHTPLGYVGVAASLDYAFEGTHVRLAQGVFATEETYVRFEGESEWGEASRLPFHVTSANWQESDRLLAGLMTAFGVPTRAIPVDGVGEFDGVVLGALRRPRIEGRFVGDAMRAFDVTWGAVDGDVVIENAYATVSSGVIRDGTSRIDVAGQFSIGFPRRDGGEEINARVAIAGRPVTDLLAAFDLEDYPVEGSASGDFHVYGPYTRPHGYGRLDLERGTAYGEPFAAATASLRFEGNGVRLDAIQIQKGGGAITGAAFVGWNGTYSFNVDGRRMAIETLNVAATDRLPTLTGFLDFTAGGSATFAEPGYDVKVAIRDLFVGDEGIGQVTGRLAVREKVLTYEVEAASPRLAVSGTGRIALTPEADAELSFRVTDTSLDPYVRAVQPTFSPFTTAIASGTIRVTGELYNPDALRIDTLIEQLDLRLFDYQLRNQGTIAVSVERQTLLVESLRLVGDDTALDLAGSVDLRRQALSLQANGAANLAVLQGFFREVRSSGRADVTALIGGTVSQPQVSGQSLITEGRLRHFSFPHALENINGIVSFNAGGIRLDGVSAQLGGGPVRFGGRIGIVGYRIADFDVTATGEDLRLRFPEGMRSVVDVTLALQGPAESPALSGTVAVDSALWTRGFGGSTNMFGIGGEEEAELKLPVADTAGDTRLPLRYDIRVVAPAALRIENDQASIVASADLNLRGTFDRPLLFGRADIERGEVRFEGRRYLVTRGSLDFTNPNRVQPFFDVEAETRVRVPNQTYQVTMRVTGTTDRLQPTFSSDPPLPSTVDILSLLFSDAVPSGDVELASLQLPGDREQRLLEARATRALTGALSDEVGKVVEQTFGVDTFQITPLLVDPYQATSRLNVNPAARITIGKRISERVYLTYAQSLSSSRRDEIILLEYDHSDTLAWVLSQNEDRTYALEVRKRLTF
jgi:hypothetical protein